jgi:integrase
LRWSDVDWGTGTGGRFFIRRSIYRGKITEPKTAAGVRRVDVSQDVLKDLQVYQVMYPPLAGDLIFRTGAGTPMDPDDWAKRRFYPLLKTAGLRRLTFHACRHTYASLLINQGESIKYVSRQLGHASINITADLYGHLFKETSTAAMKRLDEAVAARQKEKAQS